MQLMIKVTVFIMTVGLTVAVLAGQTAMSSKAIQTMIYNGAISEISANPQNENMKSLFSSSIPFNGEIKSISDFKSRSTRVKSAEIVLRLINPPPEAEIYIMRNGEEVAKFKEETAAIAVTNNSLIEIKTAGNFQPFAVEFVKKPDNIILSNSSEKLRIQSRLHPAARIFIN